MRWVVFATIALSASTGLASPARSFLDKNCVGCHSGANPPMGVDLAKIDLNLNDTHTFNRWVRIHDVVRNGQMPPGGKLPPDAKAAFLKSVASPILAHERKRVAEQGRSVLRRLNRYEYENTVRDLLGAPWLQLRDSLPEDGLVARFNKVGQALDISHVQMARYIETAEQALRAVLHASRQQSSTKRYYARDQKRLLGRMRYTSFNRHPERATIPILGFEAQPDVLEEKVPITVGDSNPKIRELEGFATPAGTYVGNEYHFDGFSAPSGGRYKIRFNAFSLWIHTVQGSASKAWANKWYRPDRTRTSKGRTVEPITLYAFRPGGEKRLLGTFDVTPEPGFHDLDVHLVEGEYILPDAARLFRSRPGFIGSPDATAEGMPGVAYRWMDVTGPIAKSPVRLFDGPPEQLLRDFIARAYRRPPTEAEVQRYLRIVEDRKNAGPVEALIAGYTAVLCSPGFLYLDEKPGPLDSYALASRLSYFLWNTSPDPELRKLAVSGALRNPQVLREQTNRLLDHPRARDFIDAFLDYWLDLRKLNDTTPDVTLYPDYYLDDLLTESALSETQLFFEHLVRKNLPVRNIVHSDFTILNSHLARHYGLGAASDGVAMRYTKLPPNSPRGGLLTQASVLKVTANGTTTSPVLRGVWIMERIVGDPPSPPPPGVPAVEPDTRGATTIRQQLDKHRSVAACAGCHKKIDPPGFALESFDVLGGFRERYRSTEEGEPVTGIGKNGHVFTFRLGQPVDASGQLANGTKFDSVTGLKHALLKDERQIARNMLTQFIAYSTGAPVSFGDRAEVERILTATKPGGYGMRNLIHEIVQSKLFRSK